MTAADETPATTTGHGDQTLPDTTAALVVTRHGGSDVLAVEQRPVSAPGRGEILVRLGAAGVNFIDVYQRQGVYPIPTPFVLCSEGAGVVVAVGPPAPGEGAASSVQVGDEVAWPQFRGSAAGYVTLPAAAVVPVPAGISSQTAAAAMLQGLTAHYLVNSTYDVQEGDEVLVHAAAGGVGQLLVQLCKARGAVVIATVSTQAKAEIARGRGADHVVNYTEVDDLAATVRELTGGRGVAVVYDGVGRTTFDASLASLRPRGMMALFGAASGQVPPFDIQRLNTGGSLFLTRPTVASYLQTRAELLDRSDEILGRIAAGTLQIEIGGSYPFTDAARAYDDLEGRRTTGKLLLTP